MKSALCADSITAVGDDYCLGRGLNSFVSASINSILHITKIFNMFFTLLLKNPLQVVQGASS